MKQRQIKVLHVALSDKFGGIETFIRNILLFSSTPYEHYCILEGDPQYDYNIFENKAERIYRLPYRRHHPIQYYKEFITILSKQKFDVVHFHKNSARDFLGVVICKIYSKAKVVVHSHMAAPTTPSIVMKILHLSFRPILNLFADQRVGCSSGAVLWLFGARACHDAVVLKNGINTERYCGFSTARKEFLRRQYKINQSFVICHIGSFKWQKNHSFLIKIFKEINTRIPDSCIVLLGEGSLMHEIKSAVKKMDIEDSVLFFGHQDRVTDFLMLSDVFLMPSLTEGSPFASVEAQAVGIPCVVSDAGNIEGYSSNNLRILNLKLSPEKWAIEVINMPKDVNCQNVVRLKDSGYDINDTILRLEGLYRQL